MPASTTVPEFLARYQTLLEARPALAGVAVRVGASRIGPLAWEDTEAIVLTSVVMNGAEWLGWGGGPDSYATVQPLTLNAYAYAELPGNSADKQVINAAFMRVGVLLVEAEQQLREVPDMVGALVVPRRLQPPMVALQTWGAWPAEDRGVGTTSIRVDFAIVWQAVST